MIVNSCTEHVEKSKQEKRNQKKRSIEDGPHMDREISSLTPGSFTVEGEQREANHTKKVRVNKQKEAKKKRYTGKEYINPNPKRVVAQKTIGNACTETSLCQKLRRK